MFVYLNKRYIFKNVIVAVELAVINSKDDIVYEIVRRPNFSKIEEKYKGAKYDFSVVEGDIRSNTTARVIDLPMIESTPEETSRRIDYVKSLYDLLTDLANLSCGYMDNIDDIENDYTGYVPSFRSIRVSSSTMTITISLYDNDRWKTRKIVDVTSDGMLQQQPFYCLIPTELENKFSKYDLTFIKSARINNYDYKIFKYNCTLPICNSTSDFSISDAVVAHYSYYSYICKCVTTTLRAILRKFQVVDETTVQSTSFSKSTSFTNKSGVFFNIREHKVTKDDADALVELAQQIVDKVGVNVTLQQINNICVNSNYPRAFVYGLGVAYDVLKSYKDIKYDLVDNTNTVLSDYNKEVLLVDLFLYNMRVSCMYNPLVMGRGRLIEKFDIIGSSYNTIVTVVRR